MSQNGNLPKSALSPIAGGGELANDAAAAWNALAARVYAKTGEKISASEAYRDLDRQWYFWDLYQSGQGNLAAYPGTSNHGMGLAVDLSTTRDRELIDKYGAAFGWSKSWSDAPSEWWHIVFQSGHYKGKNPGPDYEVTDPKIERWQKEISAKQKALGDKRKKISRIRAAMNKITKAIKKLRGKIKNRRKR